MLKNRLAVSLISSFLILAGCQKNSEPKSQYIEKNGFSIDKKIGDDRTQFRVVSRDVLFPSLSSLNDNASNSAETSSKDLILGFPKMLLGEQNVFGGIVTEVSDPDSPELGGVKMSEVLPTHVRTVLSKNAKKLLLQGCDSNCDETSTLTDLYEIPVIKQDSQFLYLDLATFGSGLDIVRSSGVQMASSGIFGKNAIATRVLRFDFSSSTLVFDVENTYDISDFGRRDLSSLRLTTRWYLKLSSGFNPNFIPRTAHPGVGFFKTSRGTNPVITRFSTTSSENQDSLIKYYIKGVPEEYKKAFADGLEDWNVKLFPLLRKTVFSFEFIDPEDSRYPLIVTGDVRYNVIEWDTKNRASYGGLGPTVANQMTGEIFSANVLVQGPQILKDHLKWWTLAHSIKNLEQSGETEEASRRLKIYLQDKNTKAQDVFSLFMGKRKLVSPAHNPHLADEAMDRWAFVPAPKGVTFSEYMYGYFRGMISHEVGHNLGLRHNFRGSLGATDTGAVGSASRSVMEYLDRRARHLAAVGPYDVMAVAYGYKGISPARSDWYCGDEDQMDLSKIENSPECSISDLTADPFGFYVHELQRAKNFLLLPGSDAAPVWSLDLLRSDLLNVMTGLVNYSVSAKISPEKWTQFYNQKRPIKPSGSFDYIKSVLEKEFCDDSLNAVVLSKKPQAQEKTRENLKDFRRLLAEIIYVNSSGTGWKLDLRCLPSLDNELERKKNPDNIH